MTSIEALRRLLDDPDVTDVLVNHGTELWCDRSGTMHRAGSLAPGAIDVELERILAPIGRRLDRLHPIVDARLADGTRVSAVVSPIAVHGTCVAFRLLRHRRFTVADFSSDTTPADELLTLVDERRNVLVSGATGSGKTSLLGALVSAVSPHERVVILEDVHELVTSHPHLVRLETRLPTADERAGVDLDDLLRASLRLRPDRLVVGEVRGHEALTLVNALNTGHLGSLSTVHANNAHDALRRLGLLLHRSLHGVDARTIENMVRTAVHVVVHLGRDSTGCRRIEQVLRLPR
jgi:pilus assembly protein CpaF